MLNDEELVFGRIISHFIIADSGSAKSFRSFRVATGAVRKVLDNYFSAAKCKAQAEAHATVSDTIAASKLVADQGSMIK